MWRLSARWARRCARRMPRFISRLAAAPRDEMLKLQAGLSGYSLDAEMQALLLDLDACLLDDRTPLGQLGFEIGAEFLGCRSDHKQSELLQPSLDDGIGENGDGVGVHLAHDLRWRLGRHEEGVPAGHIEAGQTGLCQGRNVRR